MRPLAYFCSLTLASDYMYTSPYCTPVLARKRKETPDDLYTPVEVNFSSFKFGQPHLFGRSAIVLKDFLDTSGSIFKVVDGSKDERNYEQFKQEITVYKHLKHCKIN